MCLINKTGDEGKNDSFGAEAELSKFLEFRGVSEVKCLPFYIFMI